MQTDGDTQWTVIFRKVCSIWKEMEQKQIPIGVPTILWDRSKGLQTIDIWG